VAGLFANHLHMHPVHQLMGDVGVAEAVKGNAPHADCPDQTIKGLGESVGVPRYSAVTEDKLVSADPRMLSTMRRQCLYR